MEKETAGGVVRRQRELFDTGATRDVAFREKQLLSFAAAVTSARPQILKALKEDLGKPPFESYVAEISHVLQETDRAARKVRSWSRTRRRMTPSFLFPASSFIYPEPLGVVLIIGPWNYPFDLVAAPLIGAMAAGNCAVVKPSEISPATSGVLARIIGDNFDPAYAAVVEGGRETTEALLEERLDHIFYTGGAVVGRSIMRVAAENLTPVTLELGGKSPCIVEADADLDRAARRITWGKYFNAGQTCVAPDYLLVNKAAKQELIEAIARYVKLFYGSDPRTSPDFARIVSERHFERLSGLMGRGRVLLGGQADLETRYIAPTVIDGVGADDPVMREEVFGPILPVVEYDELDDAIAFVKARPKPLSLYFFSRDRDKQRRVTAGTSSGGCCLNDVLIQFSNVYLPFGGVGMSGFGKYHGKFSFETFSNMKAVMRKGFHLDLYIRYPPYRRTQSWAQRLIRYLT